MKLEVNEMSSAIRRRKNDINLAISANHARDDAAAVRDKIHLLKQLAMKLQRELESLNQVPTPAVERGLDFYDEVRRFEIELIKRALAVVGGHQGKAAQLLNLKETTLGAKIKRYYIDFGPFAATARGNNGKS